MGGLGGLLFDVGASTVTLSSDLARGMAITDKFVSDVNVTLGKVGAGANFSGVSSQVETLKSSFLSLQSVVASVFGVGLGVGMVRQAAALADEWQGVDNRIRTTVSSAAQLSMIQDQIFATAQQTGAAVDDTAKLYQRLEQSIQGSGKSQADSQREAIALTKTLNEEIVVSGASAGEASRSIMDLVHGLSGGVLHAQQLRPIMRQMPDLAHQIAEGLGLSAAQFEEMVHKGLPAAEVLKALAAQSDAIDQRFQSLPKTFARAWTELHNAVEKYVGEASQASVVSDVVKNSIGGLATNIDAVATGAEAVAIALAAWLGGKGLGTVAALAATVRDAALAQGAYKTAAIATAEADIAGAAAQKTALAQTIARVDAQNDLRVAELANTQATVAALTSEQALLEARQIALPIGVNILAEEERLTLVRTQLAEATAAATKLQDGMAAAQARAVMAEDAETAAMARLTAAQTSLDVARAEAVGGMGMLSRAGSSVLAMIGGWPTVIMAAVGALIYFANQTDAVGEEIDRLNKQTADLERQNGSLVTALYAVAHGIDATKMSALEKAQADVSFLKGIVDTASSFDRLTGKLGDYEGALGVAEARVRQLDIAQKNLDLQQFIGKLSSAALAIRDMFAGNQAKFDAELGAKNDALFDRIDKETAAEAKRVATFGLGRAATVAWERDQAVAAATAHLTGQALDDETRLIYQHYDSLITNAQAEDHLVAAKKSTISAIKEQSKLERESTVGLRELAETVNSVSGKVGGDYSRAWSTYVAVVAKLDQEYSKAVASGRNLKEAQQLLATGTGDAKAQFEANVQAMRDENDATVAIDRVMQAASVTLNEHIRLSGLSAEQQKIEAQYTSLLTAADRELLAAMGPLTEANQKRLESLHDTATAIVKVDEATENSRQVVQDWVSVWANAGNSIVDTFSKILVEGGSLMDGLKSIAKQTVEAIISYFGKLAIINPLLNSIFGGAAGFSLMPTLASAGASAVAGGSGSAAGSAGGTSGDLFGTAQGGVSLFNAGKTMFAGFQNAYTGFMYGNGQGFGSSMFGSYESIAGNNVFAPSALGYGASIAGGVYAGYNRYQGSNGGVGGVAGGLSYGLGTTAIGLGMAGVASGAGFAAGVGALGALGPIGWAAIALMAVDMISGGKLFGTKGKFNFGEQAVTVGASGATVTTGYDLKGQKAFFGGSTHSWQSVATDPAVQQAWNDFFTGLTTGLKTFADTYGKKAGDIVAGTFAQTFDKHGNVTGSTTTIAGHTYSGETADQFQQREVAENMLSVLDQFDSRLDSSIDKYRANADTLMAIVQSLAQAETMMQDGTQFLALGKDQSLSALVALAQGTLQFGETVDQALQRILQSQAQYNQFVGQFKKPTNYVDDFEATLAGINDQMLANIKTANDLAKAAGAEGAAEQDLANIHSTASQQMAAALRALEASAQSLAFSMGLTTMGSLDEVNAEISRLQGKANAGASAVSNFGNSMQAAAQQATNAMNLLLGDLSPLNDQQKLEKARAGLVAGTASVDQFLQIARRLYASSQQYTDEFNFAQQYANRASASGTTHGGTSGVSSGGLSSAEQQRLADLLKEQTQLQAQQQLTNAQTLAQQIAEIAAAKGEDYKQVAADMHIDLAGLEKQLNMSDDAFAKLIADDQARKDDNGQNTATIVNAIDDMSDAIVTALGKTPGSHSDHAQPGANDTRGGISREDMRAFGHEVGRQLGEALRNGRPRNTRPVRI